MKLFKKFVSVLLSALFVLTPLCGTVVFADPAEIYVDFSIDNFDYVTADTVIEVAFSGDAVSYKTRLEGEVISTESNASFTPGSLSLTNGVYTLVAEAVDSEGTSTIGVVSFTVVDSLDIGFTYNENEDIVPVVPGATAQQHKVEPLGYTVGYGTASDGYIPLEGELLCGDYAEYGLKYLNLPVETSSASGIPYQTFDVDVNGKTEGEVIVRYTGSTVRGERIALRAYNVNSDVWDTVGTFYGSDSTSVALDVATYSDNGVIHVAAILDYVTNGSDIMIWSTDPQHYTKFEDLNEYYYKIYKYAAEEYAAGKAGYIITTGDLVDDLPKTSAAIEQWKVADKAMSYLEQYGMPNGLVSGNHDVGTVKITDYTAGDANVDYSKYHEYFGASRYNNERWFGGSLNNNTSHYDLVTVGNVDFIILYLGYGVEATDETIVWANEVLQTYSHRTAIVATHEYLDAQTADRSVQSRAQLIFDEIIEPNYNVKLLLCGHDDGSICRERTTSDGRTVYEILSDYQFVEAEDDDFYENEHYIGSVPECCGDGYIRLLTVKGSTLSSITYSPVTNKFNPYGDRENLTIDLGCDSPLRSIATVSFSAYVLGDAIDTDDGSSSTAIVITDASGRKTYHHVSYAEYPDEPEAIDQTPVDLAALELLISKASEVDTTVYTAESVIELEFALENAKNADKTNHGDVVNNYVLLSFAMGALKKIKTSIDPSTLSSVYTYDLTTSKWTTSDVTMTQLSPGIHMTRAEGNTNGWASIRYNESGFELKPENGRIYMNLDIDADSAWSILVFASQANLSTSLRMNFAIDNAFNSTAADSYNGIYNGVYEVTEAFEAAGFDPGSTIKIEGMYLFIVPGDVSYKHVEYLTDKTSGSVDKTRLNKAVSDAEALDSTLYTSGSFAGVTAALTEAKAAQNLTVQADLNLAALKLEQAMAALKLLADVIPEPEGSLLPADEGLWKQTASGTMKIFRDESNYTVLQNTNGEWPSADHVMSPAYTTTTADKVLAVDVTVNGQSSFILSIDGSWVYLNEHITSNRDSGSGDVKSGSYTVEIPLSKLSSKESISISTLRVFAVGDAGNGSAVTIRRMQIIDYVAPPAVEDKLADLMVDSDKASIVSGEGSVTVEDGVLIIKNDTDGDLRVAFESDLLFNLDVLNALHIELESTIPFKMAYNIVGTDESSAWPNTSSDAYSDIFTVTDDRAAAGKYDAYLEMRDNCTTITDKTSVYYKQFIILVTGKGEFKLSVAEMVAYDTFDWPDVEYGAPATPDNRVYDHAAKDAPIVEEKVDLLPYFKAGSHPIVSSTIQTENGLGIEIDIEKTPYLYYSFIVPESGDFTFSIYSNSNYSPWLSYLDAQLSAEKPTLNYGAANWDANTSRQQYTKTSQTGCIDMRDYLVDPEVQKWVINQLKLYKSTSGSVVVSYLFFGSGDATVPNPDPNPNPDPDPDPEYVRGDVNGDGAVNQYDYILVKRHYFGTRLLTEDETLPADANKDGAINQYDYILIKRHYFGTFVIG